MNWVLYMIAGCVSGILSGMGIGGGVLLIPALVIFGSVAQHSAQGINLLYFLPTAASALWVHRKSGKLEKQVLPALILGGIAGAVAGGYIATLLEAEVLRKLFGGFVAVMGILEIRKGIRNAQSSAGESGAARNGSDAGAGRPGVRQNDHDRA